MSSIASIQKKPGKKMSKKGKSLWMKNVLTRTIVLPFKSIGGNIVEIIKKKLEANLYNKCCPEGYIKYNSINILTHSSGEVKANDVSFSVMFECLYVAQLKDKLLKLKLKILQKLVSEQPMIKKNFSITVFIAEITTCSVEFSKIKQDEDITIKVIGIRYELNDQNISVLGELRVKKKPKTKVTIVEE